MSAPSLPPLPDDEDVGVDDITLPPLRSTLVTPPAPITLTPGMINRADAEKHIKLLFGDADPTKTVCVFQIVPHPDDNMMHYTKDGVRKARNPILVGTLDECWKAISNYNSPQRKAAIYISVNACDTTGYTPPAEMTEVLYSRPKTAPDAIVKMLVYDDDGTCETPPAPKLPPTAILQTSNSDRKKHGYFAINSGEPIARWTEAELQLACHLQTDKAIAKSPRQVLRLAGSWNWKRKDPYLTRWVSFNETMSHTLTAMIDAHPILESNATDTGVRKHEPITDWTPTEDALTNAHRVESWLIKQKIEFSKKTQFHWDLKVCPTDPAHPIPYTRMISIIPTGAILSSCFHNHCGNNAQSWMKVKKLIGGWGESGDWGFNRGDHPELAAKLNSDLKGDSFEDVVHSDGQHYRCDPATKQWHPILADDLTRIVSSYAGMIQGITKRLALKDSDIVGTIRLASKLINQPDFFALAPAGVPFRNGFLRFADGVTILEPFTAAHRIRSTMPYDYDQEARAARFLLYLDECFINDADKAQKIAFLQEWIGVTLFGEAWRFEVCAMLTGLTQNGKSVLIDILSGPNDHVPGLFPQAFTSTIKPQDLDGEGVRAALRGKLLNAVSEIPERDILASASFKEIVGGKLIRARELYKGSFFYRPRAGHMFSANDLPASNDYTPAFFRRFAVIHFNRHFQAHERDLKLAERIAMTELAGIALWAVEGARRALTRGSLLLPPSAETSGFDWQQDIDPVMRWVNETTEIVATPLGTTLDDLYEAYAYWASKNGHAKMSSATLRRRLRSLRVGTYPVVTLSGQHQTMYSIRVRTSCLPPGSLVN
jgi:P4 family phage/plasmid primase-like protien